MLEIENYSFSFKLNLSNPNYFSSYNPNLPKRISKNNKTQPNYNSKPKYKKYLLQHHLYEIKSKLE